MGLSPADRKLLAVALAAMALMTLVTAALTPEAPAQLSPVPSSYSSSPGGALAAFMLLARLQYPVTRWEETPMRLPDGSSDSVLILAEPSGNPTDRERGKLQRFVENGGRILFCGASLPTFFNAHLKVSARSEVIEPEPAFPSRFTRGARRIRMARTASWDGLPPEKIALYTADYAPLAVMWRIGSGEVLWWAAATPLTNAEIGKADDLNLLLNAVAPRAGQTISRIYWDEYFHGGRGSLWSYAKKTPLKWTVVQCFLLFAAALFTWSRRSGPVWAPRPVSRLAPLEFVETLGAFYGRARAVSVPVEVAHSHLRVTVARRLRLSPALSDRELAEAAEPRLGWNAGDFASILEKAASASRKLRAKEALHLVQSLGAYSTRLLNYSPQRENK